MLQLPATHARVRQFSNADIAAITRGSKALKARKPKADPIIGLIARADRALDRWIAAENLLFVIKEKLPQEDRGWVNVSPIDEPVIFREFGHGFCFTSEAHVISAFRRRRRRARELIAYSRSRLKMLRPRHGSENAKLQHQQTIDSNRRLLKGLVEFEEAQKKAVRNEARRLRKIQKSSGLLKAREQRSVALSALHKITKQIAALKPTSQEGALAVILYVGKRLFPDRYNLFTFDVDGRFLFLLREAHKVLAKTAVSQ